MFGSLISRIALPFLVIYALRATPSQMAWIRIAEVAPGIVAGLLAGVVVDRLPRRPMLIGADGLRAVLMGAIALLFWMQRATMADVLVVAAVVSVLTITFDSAYEAYLPSLVGTRRLVEANSELSATASVAEVTGFGIAGALFQIIGGAFTLSIDALSFVVSAVTLLAIEKPESIKQIGHSTSATSETSEMSSTPSPLPSRASAIREIRQGLSTLWRDRQLRSLTGISGLTNLYSGAMATVYMLYISRDLQISPTIQGLLYALGGISSFVGAAFAAPVLRRLGLGRTLVLTACLGLVGIVLVPAAFGPNWLLILFLVGQQLLGDGPDTIYEIQVTSLRQSIVPNHLLGRVNATWQVWGAVFFLIGTLGAGLVAGPIGLRITFFLAIACRAASVVWLAASRHLFQRALLLQT